MRKRLEDGRASSCIKWPNCHYLVNVSGMGVGGSEYTWMERRKRVSVWLLLSPIRTFTEVIARNRGSSQASVGHSRDALYRWVYTGSTAAQWGGSTYQWVEGRAQNSSTVFLIIKLAHTSLLIRPSVEISYLSGWEKPQGLQQSSHGNNSYPGLFASINIYR